MKLAIAVFLTTFFTDVMWTMCIRKTAQGRALGAAVCSMILVLLSAVTITSFVGNPIYIIPAAIGAFAGTYITVRVGRRG